MAAVDPRQAVLDVPQPQVERLAAGARGGFPPAAEQADVSCTEIGSNLTSRLLPPASSNVKAGAIPRPRSTSAQTTMLGIRSRTVQSLSHVISGRGPPPPRRGHRRLPQPARR